MGKLAAGQVGRKTSWPLARWATRQMLMKQLGNGAVGQWARWAPDQKGKKLSMAVGQVCKKAIEQWAKWAVGQEGCKASGWLDR